MFITSYLAILLFLDIYSISSSLQFYVIQQQTIYTLIISLVQIPVSGITGPEGGNLFKPLINIVKSPLERLEQVTHQAAMQECTCFIPWIILDIFIDVFLPLWSKTGDLTVFVFFLCFSLLDFLPETF